MEAGDVLLHLNVHSGSDSWGEAAQHEYFSHALQLMDGSHHPQVSHETHRGRPLARNTVLVGGSSLEDAIGSHAWSVEASMRVTNCIPLGVVISLIGW
jgi:hypothetical protein